jgi:hypothetical protein
LIEYSTSQAAAAMLASGSNLLYPPNPAFELAIAHVPLRN